MSTPVCFDAANVARIFKRDDIRGIWPDDLNAEAALLVGQSLTAFFRRNGFATPTIAVAHDARRSSHEILLALCRGIIQEGGQVVSFGLASTEHIYFATGSRPDSFAGGAMITASHNPAEYNGIKMVKQGAQPLDEDDLNWLQGEVVRRIRPLPQENLLQAFADHVLHLAGIEALPDSPKPRLAVVVAAGNGVGAVAFNPIAERLRHKGIDCHFTHPEPDGSFPDGVPNPLDPRYVDALADSVKQRGADLGICFDGDGDRAGFVDRNGIPITASQVLALVGDRLLQTAPANPLIMRNLCCSQLLVHHVSAHAGVDLVDTPVGHGKIKLLMRSPEYCSRVVFAGEHSGHYFYPGFYHVDSGVLTALHMLSIALTSRDAGTPIEERLDAWRRTYHWSGEINYEFAHAAAPMQAMQRICAALGAAPGVRRQEVRPDPESGLFRVFDTAAPYDPASLKIPDLKLVCESADGSSGWWLVVRPSGNEPKLRLNQESWGPGAPKVQAAMIARTEAHIRACGGCRQDT